MKKLFLIFCFLLTVICTYAQESITGVWAMEKENTKIEIKENGGISEGTVVSSDNADVIGKLLLKDVKLAGDKWTGKLYAPKLEKWMDVVITKKDANKLSLAAKAGVASRTLEWTKE
ncbi:MAG: DUF2147 domain-containing protein [Bacteroidia bacterium]|nr:DUF2147 domain-containing protein [Bacteroidia bacterium]